MTVTGETGELYEFIAADLGTYEEVLKGIDKFVSIIYDGEEFQYENMPRSESGDDFYCWYITGDTKEGPCLLKGTLKNDKRVYLSTPENGNHDIKIISSEIVHKLDKKYLPDNFDMVIDSTGAKATIEKGSYESIEKKLQNGEMVEVALLTVTYGTGEGYCAQRSCSVENYLYDNKINITFISITEDDSLQIRRVVVGSEDKLTLSSYTIAL